MPHAIVEIDELLRLVIDELVTTSPRTVVSLAVTCRSLKEPMLSSLWRQQMPLDHLLMVLPGSFWVKNNRGFAIVVSGSDFPVYRIQYQFPRQSSTILQQKIGPGCNVMLPGCANYPLVAIIVTPAIFSPESRPIHLADFCSPSWNTYTGTSIKRTLP